MEFTITHLLIGQAISVLGIVAIVFIVYGLPVILFYLENKKNFKKKKDR